MFYFFKENPYVSTFAPFISDPFAKYAFFLNTTTFYGPVWFLFTGIPIIFTGLNNIASVLLGLKLFNLFLIAAISYLLFLINKKLKKGLLAVFLFLANPVVLFEGIGNAHNDVLMTFFLVAAFYALNKKSKFTLMLIMFSVLVKFFTVVLVPVFLIYMFKEKWQVKLWIKNLFIALITLVAVLAPFWDNGNMLIGLIQGATESQNLYHVSIPSLIIQYIQHNKTPSVNIEDIKIISYVLFLILTGVLYLRLWFKKNFEQTIIDIYLLFCLIISLLYSWYLLPVFAFISLIQKKSGMIFMFILTLLSLIKYPFGIWAWFDSGFPLFGNHFFQSVFLTLPITIYLFFSIFFYKTDNKNIKVRIEQ